MYIKFTYSFIQQLFTIYYVLSTSLGTRNTAVNKIEN